jgi:uncharacterized tellurite resistance protein B-like protein
MNQKKISEIIDVKGNGFLGYLETLPESSKEMARSKYASMAVRLWYDAEGADGYRKKVEREKIISLIQKFFSEDSLFPSKNYSTDQRKKILTDLIDADSASISIEEVSEYLKTLPDSVRYAFFHDACYIICIDSQIATKEVDYLVNLGSMMSIPEEIRKKKFQFFWIPV